MHTCTEFLEPGARSRKLGAQSQGTGAWSPEPGAGSWEPGWEPGARRLLRAGRSWELGARPRHGDTETQTINKEVRALVTKGA